MYSTFPSRKNNPSSKLIRSYIRSQTEPSKLDLLLSYKNDPHGRNKYVVVTFGEKGSILVTSKASNDVKTEVSSWEDLLGKIALIKISKEEWSKNAITYYSYRGHTILHCAAFPCEEVLDSTGMHYQIGFFCLLQKFQLTI